VNRLGRWLLRLIAEAIRPLLDRLDRLENHAAEQRRAVDAWAQDIRERAGTNSLAQADRERQVLECLNGLVSGQAEALLVSRAGLEALRAWEDALLGRVQQSLEAMARSEAEALDKLKMSGHASALLSMLCSPAQQEVIEANVKHMAGDTVLREQRPDLRGVIVSRDLALHFPDVPGRKLDLARAIVYCRLRGDL